MRIVFMSLLMTAAVVAGDDPRCVVQPIRHDSVTVTADMSSTRIESPDPGQRVLLREELLDANPGHPGVPVSIPGLPSETAAGGIKAPQYFAPGVAGDHGEPIAQYIQAGSLLLPNNLSANAHGNGYADPNILIPAMIEGVDLDGGAFNVREGNHSVDLAAIYLLRPRLQPFVSFTGDAHDVNIAAGIGSIALETSLGNGFLKTPEHRRQYKLNGFRTIQRGNHEITFLGIGYYGESKIPGLVPIDGANQYDTVDPRQQDQTHTAEAAVNDVWRPSRASELQFSGFFRTYNLSLYSNFGDGLIRQSEFRTVAGGNTSYIRSFSNRMTVIAGADYLRDAPRRLDLDRYDPFQRITSNSVTLDIVSPYAAVDGTLTHWLRYDVGWRRDQIRFDNVDLVYPGNSFHGWTPVNSPKATLTILPRETVPLPEVAFSFGQSFFTNDPRIGGDGARGTPVNRAHSFQLVTSKTVFKTDFRVTLGRITQEQSLAKIDADTGLQFNEGPSRNRYVTFSIRRRFNKGSIETSFSKADARNLTDGSPLPEAPRLIFDAIGTLERLPFHLQARAEYEYVGRKPLGDDFVSVPVREFRGALVRPFLNGRLDAGINVLLASGYAGQTTEVLEFERVVGVRIPSYATVSLTYHPRRR